jgi:hypothetical protein
MADATNVTKYKAGGSGDNIIPDGYIKTVEKVWLDSYAFTTGIPSNTDLDIAIIPANKKITDVRLSFPSLSTGAAATGTTISIGTRIISTGVTNSTVFLSAGEASTGVVGLAATQGFQTVTSAETAIYLRFGRIATTTTNSTIRSIVRYT